MMSGQSDLFEQNRERSDTRIACVDLAAFPLQLLCRRHPDWRTLPVVAVAEDKPQAPILWVNEHARAMRILPGQRYAAALSLARDLRADVVSEGEIGDGINEVISCLRRFSPEIEAADEHPGVFWLNATGLQPLYHSLQQWADDAARALQELGFEVTIVVGFSRFGSYAIARHQQRTVLLCREPQIERTLLRQVPLKLLGITPRLRDSLHKLGIETLGAFLQLPSAGVRERFGVAAYQLHRLAQGVEWDPLRPQPLIEPLTQTIALAYPEGNVQRLLFLVKRALDQLLLQLAGRQLALTELLLTCQLEYRDTPYCETIKPAEATLDSRLLLQLVHLRLEHSPPQEGVTDLQLNCQSVSASTEQLQLFHQRPRRDLRAADQAVAAIRAEFGNDAVQIATMRDAHLPEATFGWLPFERTRQPQPTEEKLHLIRRIFSQPRCLPPQNHHVRDDGWLLSGVDRGPVEDVVGPFVLCGGWWDTAVHREYHFVKSRQGKWLWVYYDRLRRRWFLQGELS